MLADRGEIDSNTLRISALNSIIPSYQKAMEIETHKSESGKPSLVCPIANSHGSGASQGGHSGLGAAVRYALHQGRLRAGSVGRPF